MDLATFCSAGMAFLTQLGCFESPIPEPTPTPTPIPTASPSPTPPSENVLFYDDFEGSTYEPQDHDKGSLSDWRRFRSCYPKKSLALENGHIAISLWPAYDQACDDFFKRPRSEISGPLASDGEVRLVKDKVYKISFDVQIPESWNTIPVNTIIAQDHYGSYEHDGKKYDVGPGGKLRVEKQDNGKDAFKIEFATKKMNCSSSGCEKETIQRQSWLGPEIVKGKWYKILIHYSLKTPGFYRAYIDGHLIGQFDGETYNDFQGSTGHRIGVYSARWETTDKSIVNTVLFDNYKIVLDSL